MSPERAALSEAGHWLAHADTPLARVSALLSPEAPRRGPVPGAAAARVGEDTLGLLEPGAGGKLGRLLNE